jgi:hypothetical protein
LLFADQLIFEGSDDAGAAAKGQAAAQKDQEQVLIG